MVQLVLADAISGSKMELILLRWLVEHSLMRHKLNYLLLYGIKKYRWRYFKPVMEQPLQLVIDGNDESRIFIDNNSVDLIVDDSGVDTTVPFGATTTVGATTSEHVKNIQHVFRIKIR